MIGSVLAVREGIARIRPSDWTRSVYSLLRPGLFRRFGCRPVHSAGAEFDCRVATGGDHHAVNPQVGGMFGDGSVAGKPDAALAQGRQMAQDRGVVDAAACAACRPGPSGGIGRRTGLKIPLGFSPVRVRVLSRPLSPAVATTRRLFSFRDRVTTSDVELSDLAGPHQPAALASGR